jgi:hypothetical protein
MAKRAAGCRFFLRACAPRRQQPLRGITPTLDATPPFSPYCSFCAFLQSRFLLRFYFRPAAAAPTPRRQKQHAPAPRRAAFCFRARFRKDAFFFSLMLFAASSSLAISAMAFATPPPTPLSPPGDYYAAACAADTPFCAFRLLMLRLRLMPLSPAVFAAFSSLMLRHSESDAFPLLHFQDTVFLFSSPRHA